MKPVLLRIAFPVLLAAVVGFAAYNYYQSQLESKNRLVTCLASVIPSVVLHARQNEIVSLLESLGREAKEIPVTQAASVKPAFFSKAIDSELLNLAGLFEKKNKNLPLGESEVSDSVDRALSLMASEKTPFLLKCEKLMLELEKDCGNLRHLSENTSSCAQKYNSRIEALIPVSN